MKPKETNTNTEKLLYDVLRCLNSAPRFKFDNTDSYALASRVEAALKQRIEAGARVGVVRPTDSGIDQVNNVLMDYADRFTEEEGYDKETVEWKDSFMEAWNAIKETLLARISRQ